MGGAVPGLQRGQPGGAGGGPKPARHGVGGSGGSGAGGWGGGLDLSGLVTRRGWGGVVGAEGERGLEDGRWGLEDGGGWELRGEILCGSCDSGNVMLDVGEKDESVLADWENDLTLAWVDSLGVSVEEGLHMNDTKVSALTGMLVEQQPVTVFTSPECMHKGSWQQINFGFLGAQQGQFTTAWPAFGSGPLTHPTYLREAQASGSTTLEAVPWHLGSADISFSRTMCLLHLPPRKPEKSKGSERSLVFGVSPNNFGLLAPPNCSL